MSTVDRVVLAYSGASAGSTAIRRLADVYSAEVIAATLDLGQGRELEAVRDRALDTGAIRAHVLDVRDEFVRDYLLHALKADAPGERGLLQMNALARALLARKLIEIAGIEQATAVAYAGCAADAGFPQLEVPLKTLAPGIRIIVADRDLDRQQRDEFIKPAADWPGEPAYVAVTFERGMPTAVNGVAMPMLDLIESLGTIAAAHGVGTMRPRDLRDAPAAALLRVAHRQLWLFVTPAELAPPFQEMSAQYAEIIRKGLWFTPEREPLDTELAAANERVTGDVRLKLFKGTLSTDGIDPKKPSHIPMTAAPTGG